jgi:hypothetical protein
MWIKGSRGVARLLARLGLTHSAGEGGQGFYLRRDGSMCLPVESTRLQNDMGGPLHDEQSDFGRRGGSRASPEEERRCGNSARPATCERSASDAPAAGAGRARSVRRRLLGWRGLHSRAIVALEKALERG